MSNQHACTVIDSHTPRYQVKDHAMNSSEDIGLAVQEFYRILPFNFASSANEHVAEIKRQDSVRVYPVLPPLLKRPGTLVTDVGCGVGAFACAIAYRYKCVVSAIDFNPVAITRAREIASALKAQIEFKVADLFEYRPEPLADVVISLGVLHHSKNCPAALRRLCLEYVRAGGWLLVGLYHRYGRQPFLDYFAEMKARGASETEMLERYTCLDRRLTNRTHLLSWFRDQVLHPHETQHTLEELSPLLAECGMTVRSTSINNFRRFVSIEELYEQEKTLLDVARARMAAGTYYPGFFVLLAQKAE
jgi:2-polyprenyl-3-methyl-5-hydroxy-6-metoxy-1,4-benzoquinol methylase